MVDNSAPGLLQDYVLNKAFTRFACICLVY